MRVRCNRQGAVPQDSVNRTRHDQKLEKQARVSTRGAEAFITKYPDITKRVLKVYVQASKWLAEAPPTQIFQLWTKSGTTFSSFREDLAGEDFKYRFSPLVDEYIEARYNLQIKESKRLGLTRNLFSLKEWGEPKFLQAALKELGLEHYWQPRGHDGKPAQPDPRAASAAPSAAHPPAALAASY